MKQKVVVKARFIPRCQALEEWKRENPILLAGEHGVAIDGKGDQREKIGDGVTAWNDLEWWKGMSAYEIAVKNGFVGTEKEWLESLKIDGITSDDNTLYLEAPATEDTYIYLGDFVEIGSAQGKVDFMGSRLTCVGEPVNDSDAANKDYVDNSVEKAHKLAIPRKQFEGTMDPPQVIGIKENASLEEIDGQLYPNDNDYQYLAVDWVGLKDITGSPHSNVLAMRDGNGNLYTYEPVDDVDCVNKGYIVANYYTRNECDNYFADFDSRINAVAEDCNIYKGYIADNSDAIYQVGVNLASTDCELRNMFTHLPIPVNSYDGTGKGYQQSEKDDTAVTLGFTNIQDETAKSTYAKVYDRTTEIGTNAMALGTSVATGKRSFSAGSSNIAANEKAIALGCDNISAGKQSFTAGYANYASNNSSICLGAQNCSTGASAIATGILTKAQGDYSFTAGNGSIAGYPDQFIVGKHNKNSGDTFFEVGNGGSDTDRSTAFAVLATRENAIRIGNTTLNEAQLKKLLALIGSGGEN